MLVIPWRVVQVVTCFSCAVLPFLVRTWSGLAHANGIQSPSISMPSPYSQCALWGAWVVPEVSFPWSLSSCSSALPPSTTPSLQTSLGTQVAFSLLFLRPCGDRVQVLPIMGPLQISWAWHVDKSVLCSALSTVKFDERCLAMLGAEFGAMPPSVICLDTVPWPAWFNVLLMFLVGILVLCSTFYWVRVFVVSVMRMPRSQPFIDHALLVGFLVSLVLFLQWPLMFEGMLPPPFSWFIVMHMLFVGILVGLLSAFSWGRSFVGAAMRLTRFQFLVIAAVLVASLVSFVLFVSFGSALSLVWCCPTFHQFILMMFLCLVCRRARLVLGCFGSGQAKDKKFSGKRVLRYLLIFCKVFLPIQVCGTCAAAYVEDFHKVARFAAAACQEAFSRLFTLVICEFFVWLGTLGDHVESARVRITLQCDIEKGFIATLAMVLLVCFSTGRDIGHVLGLRIVGLGCGGCQARGLSVAWLAQATPRLDVAIVPFWFLKNLEFLVVLFALVRNMSFVVYGKFVKANDELQQHAAAALNSKVSFESVPGMPETEHRGSLSDGEKREFQILVKGLDGRHIALPVFASMTVLELAALVHCRSLVPVEAFYLVKEGKRMGDHNILVQEGVLPGDTVHMCGRLRAGAQTTFPSHMDWFCVACNRGGCWASRPRCFRCGLSRAEGEQAMHNIGNGRAMRNGSVQPAPRHVPPRETQFPGRSGAGPFVSSCPTWRPPKLQKQKRNVPSSAPQPDVLSILRELGCSSDLLMQVQNKLGGASSPEVPAPGIKAKKLADAQAALGRAKTHQLVLREQHEAMAVKLSKAKLALDENQERIQKLTAEVQLAHAELTPPRSEDGASCNAGDAVELDGAEVSDASFESEGHDDSDIYPDEYKDAASVPTKKRRMIAKPKPKPDKPVVIVTAAQARDFFLGLPEEERLRFIGECSSAGASSASMELSPTPCG